MATASKTQYENFAPKYSSLETTPYYRLEAQLIQTALGDCTNLNVLDLGGGSGLHARDALQAGAAKVDVVDISPAMMKIGQDIEKQLGREGKISWHIADVSRPLSSLDLLEPPGSYDVVMANWVIDHAATLDDLKGIWKNVALYLKPKGGRFLGIRVCGKGLRAEYMKVGRYGVKFKDIEEIPGGVRYQVGFSTEQDLVEFEATTMEESSALIDDVPRGLGIGDLKVVPSEDMDIVKGDREFWKEFLEEPFFVVVTGRKG
ncbi:hypothetical protein G7Y89_g12096 [Cudoniella acicularis]|uniref:Methyltransferase domain-containing protein n=1 Tax=Cudoniella acicularis TaxID=354080 RepID=A0A8H4VXC9_9HELO|nr:hypothetical protein G7Y89_g12096 [Cudoniella acicularis]